MFQNRIPHFFSSLDKSCEDTKDNEKMVMQFNETIKFGKLLYSKCSKCPDLRVPSSDESVSSSNSFKSRTIPFAVKKEKEKEKEKIHLGKNSVFNTVEIGCVCNVIIFRNKALPFCHECIPLQRRKEWVVFHFIRTY